MSQELATRPTTVPAELQEKVLLGGDLARLTPTERLSYYNAVCTSVGLNPLTRPFEYLILNDKMVLYARKDCTDQLRDLHGISVEIASREVIDGVCVVTARAKNMTERIDESVGAVPFMKEDGEWKSSSGGKSYFQANGNYKPLGLADRANAMMKAETKAKRRVTLSICGLGMFDESELEGVPDAKKVYHAEETERKALPTGAEMLAKMEAVYTSHMDTRLQGAGVIQDQPKDAPAPPDDIFAQSSAVADYEVAMDECKTEDAYKALWVDITRDKRLTSETRKPLYDKMQKCIQKIRGKK